MLADGFPGDRQQLTDRRYRQAVSGEDHPPANSTWPADPRLEPVDRCLEPVDPAEPPATPAWSRMLWQQPVLPTGKQDGAGAADSP